MKLSKYYRKEHVGEDCYVLYNTLHMKPIINKMKFQKLRIWEFMIPPSLKSCYTRGYTF